MKGVNMIIDMHAHTSNHQLWNLHTADASIAELKRLAKIYGITRIYLMATYFPLKKSGLHNLELLERISNEKLFGCFGSLNLETKDLILPLAELRYLAKIGLIEGLKIYPGYQDILLADNRFYPVYELAQKFGLPVAIHMGELHHCCSKNLRQSENLGCGRKNCPLDDRFLLSSPKQLAKVARDFPSVNFIACHLANPFFQELRQVMSLYPNVYTDISGQFVSGTEEDTPEYRVKIVEEIKKFFDLPRGLERIMFATDFPIQSYQDTFDLVKALNLNPAEKEMLLAKNALRILPPKGWTK